MKLRNRTSVVGCTFGGDEWLDYFSMLRYVHVDVLGCHDVSHYVNRLKSYGKNFITNIDNNHNIDIH